MDELRTKYACHTIILYGSRARGDARATSDYDVLGVRESGTRLRDARVWNGVYLDLVIYAEGDIVHPDEQMLPMRGGVVLTQKARLGDTFLAHLDAIFLAGPTPLAADEHHARKVWATKMLDRAREGDIEGNYRRTWLLMALLEDYFQLRTLWYLGPKQSFAWLKVHDPDTFAAFDTALRVDASIDVIERLIEHVTSTQ
jgi:hypothetical protein